MPHWFNNPISKLTDKDLEKIINEKTKDKELIEQAEKETVYRKKIKELKKKDPFIYK